MAKDAKRKIVKFTGKEIDVLFEKMQEQGDWMSEDELTTFDVIDDVSGMGGSRSPELSKKDIRAVRKVARGIDKSLMKKYSFTPKEKKILLKKLK